MPYSAREFQKVIDVLKHWWRAGFEQLKINGQLCLCDRDPSFDFTAYVIGYCSKREPQLRGAIHPHVLSWVSYTRTTRAEVPRHIITRRLRERHQAPCERTVGHIQN